MKRALILAIIFLFASAHPARAEGPVTLRDYREAVATALSLVEQANGSNSSEQDAALLKQAAARLETITQVQLESGQRVPVDNRPLIAELNNAAQNAQGATVADALERLRALNAALGESPARVNEADLASLSDILSKPPFAPVAEENWLQ